MSALSQQVITRLQETDKTVWQRQSQNTNNKRKSTKEQRPWNSQLKLVEGLKMFHDTNLTLNSDVDQDI